MVSITQNEFSKVDIATVLRGEYIIQYESVFSKLLIENVLHIKGQDNRFTSKSD